MHHSRDGTRRFERLRYGHLKPWAIAVLLSIAALLARLALNSLEGGKAPFVTFLLATIVSAALSGFWPGIVTAAGGALLSRFVVPQTNLLAYLVSAICVCAVCEVLIRARERARDAEQQLRETERQLQVQAEELRRSNRDLEEFAFVASHDMQESLRMVNIYTQLLLRKMNLENSAELAQYGSYVNEGVERIQRLIGDLLDFSRVIHNEANSIVVDAHAAALEAMKISEDAIQESGALIKLDPLPMVLAEEAHLVRIFHNLISNSLKYRKENEAPRIHISAALENGQATFQVQDNGIGFEPEFAQKVFKLFTRLHGKQYPGSGLGLTICHRIVERYGGRIWVVSEPGEGSTFFFTLPKAGAEPSYDAVLPARQERAERSAHSAGEPPKLTAPRSF